MIAIIGMAGRFCRSARPSCLLGHAGNGREGLVRLGDSDLLASGVPRKTFSDPRYVPARACCEASIASTQISGVSRP